MEKKITILASCLTMLFISCNQGDSEHERQKILDSIATKQTSDSLKILTREQLKSGEEERAKIITDSIANKISNEMAAFADSNNAK